MNKKNRTKVIEKIMHLVFFSLGITAVLSVVVITAFLVVNGTPAMKEIGVKEFLFGTTWASTAKVPEYGILPFILSSIFGTFGAILIAVPIGIMCAIFIGCVAPPKLASVIRTSVELLSGIPSVVYGLVGMVVLVPFVRGVFNLPDGANLFSAIIVLAVMILPPLINVSETALRAVPREYKEGSLALGATKGETIFKVVLLAAKSGIFTSIVLGIGRAIGEATAIMMVAGNVSNMPGIFKSVRFLTTAVVSEMSYSSGLQREALFSIALVLFVFVLIINIILNSIEGGKK